jgi:hypothetical protein
VAQQLLHRPQVGPALEKMGGERVTKGMGKGGGPFSHHSPYAPLIERAATITYPERIASRLSCELGTAALEPTSDRFQGRVPNRDRASPVAFSQDLKELAPQ